LDASENLHFRPNLSEDLQQCSIKKAIISEEEKSNNFCIDNRASLVKVPENKD
jgi:hypothetical protein